MIKKTKKTNVAYYDLNTKNLLDINSNFIKPSNKITPISIIEGKFLTKYQLKFPKDSIPKNNLNDFLYAECIKEKVFNLEDEYLISYFKKEEDFLDIFYIYALKNPCRKTDIFIPNIFLPLCLDSYLNDNVFLIGNDLVFYSQKIPVYHKICQNKEDFIEGINFIKTIYPINIDYVFVYNAFFEIDFKIKNLFQESYSLSQIAFKYFLKNKKTPLKLLQRPKTLGIHETKSFKFLSKIAIIFLILLSYPLSKFIYSLYLEYENSKLLDQNLKVLESINEVYNSKKTHLRSLNIFYNIQKSYKPLYNHIADLSRLLSNNIYLEKYYFASDILEQKWFVEIHALSDSQERLISLLKDIKNTHSEVFNDDIKECEKNICAKIIWGNNKVD